MAKAAVNSPLFWIILRTPCIRMAGNVSLEWGTDGGEAVYGDGGWGNSLYYRLLHFAMKLEVL